MIGSINLQLNSKAIKITENNSELKTQAQVFNPATLSFGSQYVPSLVAQFATKYNVQKQKVEAKNDETQKINNDNKVQNITKTAEKPAE